MATPPVTNKAPVSVLVDTVVDVITISPEEARPMSVPRLVMVGCDGVTETVPVEMLIPFPAVK
jgi:hypothetical protein